MAKKRNKRKSSKPKVKRVIVKKVKTVEEGHLISTDFLLAPGVELPLVESTPVEVKPGWFRRWILGE